MNEFAGISLGWGYQNVHLYVGNRAYKVFSHNMLISNANFISI